MAFLGTWQIDDVLTFPANTHTAATGAATDADSVPSYRVYEDETGTAILNGSMAKLDDANTTGFYSEQITLSAANGFEVGKCYTVYISATVATVVGTMAHTFQVELAPATATALATVDGIVDDILIDTAEIGAAGAGLTAVPWNAAWDAEVQSEVADGLTAYGASTYAGGAVASVTGNVGGNVAGSVASVTGNVGGNVTGSVGSVAAGGITAASIATGAVDADAIAADAVAEIQSGLATAAGVSAVETDTQDIQARLPAALVSGRIDASVGAIAAGAITAASIATGAVDADALASDAGTEIGTAVWASATRTLTQGAASVVAAVNGTAITAYSDTTWSIALTGLSSMAARSKVWFIVYEDATAADTEATVLIDSTSGLTRLNGATYATAAHGALAFPSSTALTITLNATAAAQLSRRSYAYAVKMLDTDGNVSQVSHGGRLTIVQGAPQAIA